MTGSRPLTDEEIELVLSQLTNVRDKTLFVVGLKTGFRVSELISLKIENVMQHGQVASQITVARANMKGKKSSRTVPLHPKAKQALQEYISQMSVYDAKTRLFPFSRQHCHRILKDAFNAVKLEGKVTTHSLRKTYCDRVHTALGENIFKTQIAMGHASPASTVHYLSFKQSEIDAAILGV